MASRRTFLTHSCGMGAAVATSASTLLSMAFARQTAAAHHEGDYKALVCIMLAGGNDAYNMLVPYDQDQYEEYRIFRADLALPHEDLLALPPNSEGRTFGLHPGMAELEELYRDGEVALVNNVGTLIEPIDPVDLQAGRARVPVGLYSHSDQQMQWQTAVSYSRSATQGWAGRIADLQGPELENGISMNISLSGTNVFQSGAQAVPYNIHAQGDGAQTIWAYGDDGGYNGHRKQMIDDVFGVVHENVLRNEYAVRMRKAIDNAETFIEAIRQAQEIRTTFINQPLSTALHQIARVISVRDLLGAVRQTFYVVIGGWDHHDEVLNNQARMLPYVSRAMRQFREALRELNVYDKVTVFTVSDFGRTLTSNGKGSDHGWGAHHLIMGGAVNGGRMYGTYPTLHQKHPMDTGRGVFMPTTSTEEYFAELALWFGVPASDLDRVLPNVRNFYSPGSTEPPIGYMKS